LGTSQQQQLLQLQLWQLLGLQLPQLVIPQWMKTHIQGYLLSQTYHHNSHGSAVHLMSGLHISLIHSSKSTDILSLLQGLMEGSHITQTCHFRPLRLSMEVVEGLPSWQL